MAKKVKKNKSSAGWKIIKWIIIHILKIPYYIGKAVIYLYNSIASLFKASKDYAQKKSIEKKRDKILSVYEDFKVIKTLDGDYNKWIDKTFKSDSKIGLILGARGSGKTAFGIKMLENAHAKYGKKCYAIGFDEKEMPSWIKVIQNISELENNAFVLIDEGGVLFNSRDSMTSANKILSELMLIARHKNLSILFISQNSSNMEINVLRQADFLILKSSSLLQKEFERKIIQKLYDSADELFKEYSEIPGITHVYADNFKGFITNKLPSFWDMKISKSFRAYKE